MNLLDQAAQRDYEDPSIPAPQRAVGRLVTCLVDDLRPHPSYVRLKLRVSASRLSALAKQIDLAFREPLVVTQDLTIIDGYARFELARLQHQLTLPCIQYELSELEALRTLIQRHHRSGGFNDFSRIMLALELEPFFATQARANQCAGGKSKGSSKLTKAEAIDVRSEIAGIAGASVGNLSKVKQLTATADPKIIEALRCGEIRIHRAWIWREETREKQQELLWQYLSERGVKKTIRHLISRRQSPDLENLFDLPKLVSLLSKAKSNSLGPITVNTIKASGKRLFLTEELLRDLCTQQE